jgi:hypothetical protein
MLRSIADRVRLAIIRSLASTSPPRHSYVVDSKRRGR